MTKKSRIAFHHTLVRNTSEALRIVTECLKRFLTPGGNSTQRSASAKTAQDAVGRLRDMLDSDDRPFWIEPLFQSLGTAAQNPDSPNGIEALVRVATTLIPPLSTQQWEFSDNEAEAEVGLDFDGIYTKYRSEYRISELFDETLKLLEQIVESRCIDSVRALEDLERVIGSLRKAKDGSAFATRGAWLFVKKWAKNSAWEIASALPAIGSLAKALRKTIEETDTALEKMDAGIREDLQSRMSVEILKLDYQPLTMPVIEESADDPNVIDAEIERA